MITERPKEIEKRTNGRVKVMMHYGSTVTPADKCYDGVVRGFLIWVCQSLVTREVKVMYLMTHGPGLVHTIKPVYELEDLKGIKIRAFGTVTRIVAVLGGAPVSMLMSETSLNSFLENICFQNRKVLS